ncbi:MAG: CIA30 family protein, partial [Paracoccaceae bacterium]
YYLHIRNSGTRKPWHYYQKGFDTTSTWEEIKLPFESFMKSSSSLRTAIKQSTIKTIGIVAYGKDHTADISVMSLEFY